MSTATLSSKFQISIPKALRNEMGLKAGQKFAFLRIGDSLRLVPQRPISALTGIARGANTKDYRDRSDRDARLTTKRGSSTPRA
ncbi:MAG: AbrB/MazE/SpoVT family DNA-binding domain-containing protein [Burkholderiales bacterium]|nr:AbrB/MazE/SpoVT family DNA-binding domain-containing protein [Burkholderiales bacterium]